MSKQSDAKIEQGYSEMQFRKICANCKYFTFDTVKSHIGTNLRCHIGNFKVKKTALCDKWEDKQ